MGDRWLTSSLLALFTIRYMMGKFTLSPMFLILGIFFFHCHILCDFLNLSPVSWIHSLAVPNPWNSSLRCSSQSLYFSPLRLILAQRLKSDTYFSLLDSLFSSFPISLVSCDNFLVLFLDSVIFFYIHSLLCLLFKHIKNVFNILLSDHSDAYLLIGLILLPWWVVFLCVRWFYYCEVVSGDLSARILWGPGPVTSVKVWRARLCLHLQYRQAVWP